MRGWNLLRLSVAMLALSVMLAGAPPAHAAVAACATADATDPPDDVETSPATLPNEVNRFNQLDILSVCLTEDADALLVVVTVAADVDTLAVHSFSWTFHFTAGSAASQTRAFASSNNAETATPTGSAEKDGARIQFKILKADVKLGTPITGMSIDSSGTFINQAGQVVTGTDRMPDTGSVPVAYTMGARAPAGTDTDKDGVEDAEEVARGSDPTKADSDGDGLTDSQEQAQGTNATRPDTDGDGLTDAEEVAGKATIGGSPVEFSPTSPTLDDSDGDSLPDYDELAAAQNSIHTKRGYLEGIPGSTNPNAPDTDGDGLGDGDELRGSSSIDGQDHSFAPTDPNDDDTDNDGLTDLEEVRGYRVTQSGQRVEFSETDPTKDDTDGDGVDDFKEIQTGHDPSDSNDTPTTGPVSDTAQYLPISAALLLLVVFVSMGGILWRWG